jgi:hypothetical protein
VVQFLQVIIVALIVFIVGFLVSITFIWQERKILGRLMDRRGTQVGVLGLFQNFADGLKAFIKEIIIPKDVDKWVYDAAPVILIGVSCFMIGLIPWGPDFYLANLSNGVLFVFSYSEKAWRVLTGKGVADILSGAKLTEFRQLYFDPYIASGNYSEGIKLYTYAIGLELTDNYVNPGGSQTNYPINGIPLTDWQIGIVVVVFICLVIVTKGRIIIWIPYLFLALIGRGGGGRWGGGGTGGGGARGRF